ncbi:nicotinamide-nucleotide amidase [Granulicatella balaenopterae]|uniref:Putative competence-damage inducible protein n=1 Tax=Granulicatella balaenopterae TaxID=137733 RepID=A0A1H9GU42_9LACT|nr:competence/damage-inducible protein A [Granulicatella balaenopterae]SEQ53518.1 nicotinamide-nucleotide amidase [Granulicatella balaenopterae]
MNAEIISVGTELLMGQIVNTNSAYLANQLAELHISVYFQQTVGDNQKRLLEALTLARSRSDIIILTGGLGPTTDDLTKQTVALFLQEELVENQQALDRIIHYHKQAHRHMAPNNRLQALSFTKGETLQNSVGLATGAIICQEDTHYVLLPGPPSELMNMFQKGVVPYLKNVSQSNLVFSSRFLRFFGIGESQLVTDLKEFIDTQENPTIAPYAGSYEVVLRLTANGESEAECIERLDQLEDKIQAISGSYFYGYGRDNSLAKVATESLLASGQTIAVAESLTAGLFQATLGDQAGISASFLGGMVTYSTESKVEQLGVSQELVEEFGVVSQEVALEMAEKVRQKFTSDIGMGFTGVAGPSMQEDKPVGTVFVAIASASESHCLALHLPHGRTGNRELAVQYGLDLLRRTLEK